MLKLREFLRENIFILILLLVTVLIFVTNYIPGTYLFGWDNLSTELDPWLNLKRSIWAVWQEYQSFGLVGGMGHSSDIVRSLVVILLNYALPLNIVRYVFHIGLLFIGAAGVFTLLSYMFRESKKIFPFLGALFYLLNLGTVQMFSIPFEPFSIFYATLPWQVLVFMQYLHSHSFLDKKHLLVLLLVNVLSASQAYVQTVFFVYILVLGCIAVSVLLEHKDKHFYFKKLLIAFSLIFLVNVYWILPQIYFLSTSYNVVGEAKINQLATESVFNRNKEKGTFAHFIKMEGFYFDSVDTDGENLFVPWKNYFNNPIVGFLRFLPFTFIILGLFKFRKDHFSFVLMLILCSIALMNNEIVFSTLNDVIRGSSFLNQIFRSPFTKFILVYSFVGSYLFVNGLEVFIHLLTKRHGFIFHALSFLAIILILVLGGPVFTGNMFASAMKISVPQHYLDLMTYLKSVDKSKRIALLPEHTHWGWFKYDWGYDGSGFIWYGIEQPIVARTFDVWSHASESYFWEVKDAIEDKDVARFQKVLSKYDISYLLLDNSVTPISGQEFGLQYDQISEILEESSTIRLVQVFDRLRLYEYSGTSADDFVSIEDSIPSVGPRTPITDLDNAYMDLGDYYVDTLQPEYFYPFANLTTVTALADKIWDIEETASGFIVSASLTDINANNYQINYKEASTTIPFRVLRNGFITTENLPVSVKMFGGRVYVSIDKILVDKTDFTSSSVYSCGKEGTISSESYFSSITLKSADRGKACISHDFTLLPHWNSYIIRAEVDNITGVEPFMYIVGNKSRGQSKAELNLYDGTSYILLNPGHPFDDGYNISFQNSSYQGISSENRLYNVYIYLFPFDYLKNLRLELVNSRRVVRPSSLKSYEVSKPNYYTYSLNVNSVSPGSVILLDQAYDNGWVAFCGKELCDAKHVAINNWANGWVFEGRIPENVKIVFWPQYLEYLGLVLLAGSFVWILLLPKHKRSEEALTHSLTKQ